jgi:hypothetical protein
VNDDRAAYGAAAGAIAVALFAAGALVVPERPGFDAPGAEVAAYLGREAARIQIGCVLVAAAAPFFVWFLATVRSLAPRSIAGSVAYGCGLVFVALFLADVTALAVGALRPRSPEVASALRDFEFLAMGAAAFVVAGMLAACASLPSVWPRRVRGAAAFAALVYALRAGSLLATDGVFAADGVLGLWVPVAALAAWTAVASLTLARDLRRRDP